MQFLSPDSTRLKPARVCILSMSAIQRSVSRKEFNSCFACLANKEQQRESGSAACYASGVCTCMLDSPLLRECAIGVNGAVAGLIGALNPDAPPACSRRC